MNASKATADVSIEVRRTFNAPRELVFSAWTDPARLARWFSPSEEISNPVVEVDLRLGGRWRIGMGMPDKTLYVGGVYQEITEPDRLVFTWAWEHHENKETLVTVTFTETDGGTEVTITPSATTRPGTWLSSVPCGRGSSS